MKRAGSTLLMAIAVLATSVTPLVARAQSAENKASAEALFQEGRKLMDQGQYAEACRKLEESQKLDPGAGTLLNLAACYEKNGQTASAWVTYKDAAAAAEGRHQDWAELASDRVNDLTPKLSHLKIVIAKDAPGLEVKRDGKVVAAAVLGTPLPIDPGPHTLEASAPGKRPFSAKLTIGASKDEQTVTIPELEDGPGVAGAGGGFGAQTIGGGVALGVGGVGIALGAVFGVIALGKKSDASDPSKCTPDFVTCTKEGGALVDEAKRDGLISTISFVAGGVLAVGGVVLLLTAPHAEASKPSVGAWLGAPGSLAGLSLRGSF